MKLGCCSWSYHKTMEAGRMRFEEWLELCAGELDVEGVDVIAEQMPRRTKSCWIDTKKRCLDLQLTLVSLSPGNNFGRPTRALRQKEVDNVLRWIETASIMGAPCVRIFAGWPPPESKEKLWGPMVACVRRVVKAAGQAGITIVVEPHNDGGFLSNSTTTIRLIREVDSPWVAINLDTGNYHQPDLYAGIEESLPLARHVVAKIHRLGPDGEEQEFDYDRIFDILHRHRYRGFVTVEYEGQQDERSGVAAAVRMLRRHAACHTV